MPASDTADFVPVKGTRADLLKKHLDQRSQLPPDNSTYEDFHPGYSATLNGEKIAATYYETPGTVTDKGTFFVGHVDVTKGTRLLYTVQTGDSAPAGALRGLWTYDGHWVLEVIHATMKQDDSSGVDFDLLGEVIQDGKSLSQQQGYHETFGFQLMDNRPFYFYEKSGALGFSYAGQDVPLDYSMIPHYWCCSGAVLNPKNARNMVSLFAQRGNTWYYLEIGIFG